MKAKWSNYWHPTPRKLRRLGEALNATFGGVGVAAVLSDYKWTGITFWALGALGLFLSNLFKDENSDHDIMRPGAN